jgi:hypothetical protein
MTFTSKAEVERVRLAYPSGTRIEITFLEDPYSKLTAGSRGTVEFVDDTACLHCVFDSGSNLGLLFGIDGYRKLTVVPAEVVEQVKKLRFLEGCPNMFSIKEVFEFALRQENDYYALADYIFMNTPAYSHLILTGESEF